MPFFEIISTGYKFLCSRYFRYWSSRRFVILNFKCRSSECTRIWHKARSDAHKRRKASIIFHQSFIERGGIGPWLSVFPRRPYRVSKAHFFLTRTVRYTAPMLPIMRRKHNPLSAGCEWRQPSYSGTRCIFLEVPQGLRRRPLCSRFRSLVQYTSEIYRIYITSITKYCTSYRFRIIVPSSL